MMTNMKSIAITIGEDLLRKMDHLLDQPDCRWKSRSELVRKAILGYLSQLEKSLEEQRERAIFKSHRATLKRQAEALVREQARP